MPFIRREPEKSREEILEAEEPGQLLEDGYDEPDLRRDWYLASLETGPEYEFFEEESISGIVLEEDGKEYRIVGVPHGTQEGNLQPAEELVDRVESYAQSIPDQSDFFYEQALNRIFDINGVEMDDQSWAIDTAERMGVNYAERKAENNVRMQSKTYGAKLFSLVASYVVMDRLVSDEMIGNSRFLRDGEQVTDSLGVLKNPSSTRLRRAQEDAYRNNLPEPLSAELSEPYRRIQKSLRSERMADFAKSKSENDTVSMVVGALHMFQIPYYLRNNPEAEIETSDTDLDSWVENELNPVLEDNS